VAVSLMELDEAAGLWRVDAYYGGAVDMDALARALADAGLARDALVPVPLPDTDWVAESLKGLPPVRAGRFFVHGAHDRDKRPEAGIPLQIDAGAAFGTGHHGTTKGCLLALETLARIMRPRKVLDIGAGTGVLAIAAARLWRVPALASDIDPVARGVGLANARINGAGPLVRFVTAPGARHAAIRSGAPYDLVLANILAGPLKRMAGEISTQVARGGRLVLSGLLTSQEAMLLAAYGARGLRLEKRIRLAEWSTLILRR
jgi:ribosomal protein L11 methyltransferase